MVPAALPPVVAAEPPLEAELLLVAGALALLELSLLLPPHAANPMANTGRIAIPRIARFVWSILPSPFVFYVPKLPQ